MTIFNGKAAQVAEQQGARYNNNRARGIIMNYDDAATRRVVEMCYRLRQYCRLLITMLFTRMLIRKTGGVRLRDTYI